MNPSIGAISKWKYSEWNLFNFGLNKLTAFKQSYVCFNFKIKIILKKKFKFCCLKHMGHTPE